MHVTDFYAYNGLIFEDYLKDSDFWGITNLDVVYGMLSHFVPDELLELTDVFTDDVNTINGVFSLYRNMPRVNEIIKHVSNWTDPLKSEPCKQCCEKDGSQHIFYVTDEYILTEIIKKFAGQDEIRYRYPKYYPMHSHDRLEQHTPKPKLTWKEDGSLWELFADINGPHWQHERPFIGREIPYFHFPKTKKWPQIT
jgi:hypothetical protein